MATSRNHRVLHKRYYNVFYPEPLTDDKSPRYFFFNTLLEESYYKSKEPPILGQQIQSKIKNGFTHLSTNKNNQGLSIVQQSLNFLKQLIEVNRREEQEWLNQQRNNPDIPEDVQAQIDRFVGQDAIGTTIDYVEFINFYNQLLLGNTTFQAILTAELPRLQKIQKIWDEIHALNSDEYAALQEKVTSVFSPDSKGSDYKRKTEIVEKLFFTYISQSSNVDEYKKVLKQRSVSNIVADLVKDSFDALFNTYRKQLIILEQSGTAVNIQTAPEFFNALHMFLQSKVPEIIDAVLDKVNDSVNGSANKRQKISQLKQEFLDIMTKLAVENQKSTKRRSNKDDLLERLKQLQLLIAQSAQELQQIEARAFKKTRPIFRLDVDRSKGEHSSLAGLSLEAIDSLHKILDPLLQTAQANSKRSFNTDGASGDTAAAVIKDEASYILRAVPESDIETQLFGKADGTIARLRAESHNKYDLRLRLIREIIDRNPNIFNLQIQTADSGFNTEHINIMNLLEINEKRIQKGLASIPTHTTSSSKTDTIMVTLEPLKITPRINSDILSDIQNMILNVLNDSITELDSTTNAHNQFLFSADARQQFQDILNAEKTSRASQNIQSNEFSIKDETEKRLAKLEVLTQELQRVAEQDLNNSKKADKLLDMLKNSFRISTSVKSYDIHFDKQRGGFMGGSLGGSVEQQIANIAQMFEYGGITDLDKDWLTFAVYNTGSGTVGAQYHTDLERFLSILAVSLLFDDAGQQAVYIKQKMDNIQNQTIHQHFLHLFMINNIYVPSSYVLTLTYNHLYAIFVDLQAIEDAPTTGSQVIIDNDVNVNDIVYTKTTGSDPATINRLGRRPVGSQFDWKETFSQNKSRVSCNIVFLAGFLDLLDQMSQINNV